MLVETVEMEGRNNSVLLLGDRGTGKTVVIAIFMLARAGTPCMHTLHVLRLLLTPKLCECAC